jgi:crossover junction endodeoxyribonuclease RuvC
LRVLGIDPGSRFLGYGVLEERAGQLHHVGHGLVRAKENAPLEIRLHEIFSQLTAAVALYAPDAVAVEGVFSCRNPRSALILGHARGVALLVAAQSGLPIFEYSPAKVKKSVGAGGAGGKDAVARMVTTFLKLPPLERLDVSDALAVAMCHLNNFRLPATRSSVKKGGLASFADRLRPSYQRFEVGG